MGLIPGISWSVIPHMRRLFGLAVDSSCNRSLEALPIGRSVLLTVPPRLHFSELITASVSGMEILASLCSFHRLSRSAVWSEAF